MSLEEIMTAQLQATKESNSLLRQLLAINSTDMVGIPEACRQLGMSTATLKRRLAAGIYTAYVDGHRTRVSLSEIRGKMVEAAE